MLVVVKTVTNVKFDLEIDSSMKISDVKAKIQEQQGASFPKEDLTLVFQGKVLKDEDSVEDAKVTDKSFMVVMVKKGAKPAAAAPAVTPAPPAATGEPSATPAAPAPAAATEQSPAAPAAPAAAAPAAAAGGDAVLVGSELQSSITAITEMGFAREEVERAMRAAFNNPDRAVEYLMTGIPASAAPAPVPSAAPAGAPAAAVEPAARAGPGGPNAAPLDLFGGGGAAAAPNAESGPMAALRNNPQFAQIRAIIQQDPGSLPRMIQELSHQNPQLLHLLQQNQGEFLRMLLEPVGGGAGADDVDVAAMQQMMGQQGMGPIQIELTEEEAQAVTRLEEMGFPHDACLEAYMACEKNEEMAANLLLEGGVGMDEEM